MDYSRFAKYQLKDFLEDELFVQWVLYPDDAGNSFWQDVQIKYPGKIEFMDRAFAIIESCRPQEFVSNEERKDLVWQRIQASVKDIEQGHPGRIIRLPAFAKVAAAVLVIAATTFWFISRNSRGTEQMISYTTGFGEIKNIVLPDQSRVTLNANSSLTYNLHPENNAPREVWIQGEAYFAVQHINKDTLKIAPGERFIVHCSELNIEVLGTTFNVKSRHGKADVALISGKIRIDYTDAAKNSNTLIMAPGDYVQYTAKKVLVAKKLAKKEQLTTWTANEISFTDASLEEIAEVLEDQFGYKVNTIDTTLLKLKIEGEITVNDVAELLDVVTTTLNVKVEQYANKHITISK